MMSYRYLIGYISESRHGQHILSKIFVRNKPIATSQDIEAIQFELQKECNAEKIILLSFSKMGYFDDL